MHELPLHYNPNLPSHMAIPANSTLKDVACPGKKVRDIYSDVGLLYGSCSHCREGFVYLYKSDSWVTEKDFDTMLRDGSTDIGKVIRSL